MYCMLLSFEVKRLCTLWQFELVCCCCVLFGLILVFLLFACNYVMSFLLMLLQRHQRFIDYIPSACQKHKPKS